MTQKNTASTAYATAAGDRAAATPCELTALFLEVLRGVDREVKTTPKLGPVAQAAVAHFREIDRSLAILPENRINNTATRLPLAKA